LETAIKISRGKTDLPPGRLGAACPPGFLVLLARAENGVRILLRREDVHVIEGHPSPLSGDYRVCRRTSLPEPEVTHRPVETQGKGAARCGQSATWLRRTRSDTRLPGLGTSRGAVAEVPSATVAGVRYRSRARPSGGSRRQGEKYIRIPGAVESQRLIELRIASTNVHAGGMHTEQLPR